MINFYSPILLCYKKLSSQDTTLTSNLFINRVIWYESFICLWFFSVDFGHSLSYWVNLKSCAWLQKRFCAWYKFFLYLYVNSIHYILFRIKTQFLFFKQLIIFFTSVIGIGNNFFDFFLYAFLKTSINALNSDVIPTTFLYPSAEQSTNTANYTSGVNTLAPKTDENKSKVWWQQ